MISLSIYHVIIGYLFRVIEVWFTKAERELSAARPFGYGLRKFYYSSHLLIPPKKDEKDKEAEKPAVKPPDKEGAAPKKVHKIYIAVTSDRGLCGGVHSGVARRIRRELTELKVVDSPEHRLVCIGDKSRSMLRRLFAKNMLVSVKDIGRMTPIFADASTLAAAIADSKFKYDMGDVFYNKFFSAVKYELTVVPVFNKYQIESAPNMTAFDDIEEDMLESYAEFTLAALLYYVLKESATSEQSARMAAMDNATKNASEMIRKLTLLFNRTRQAVITKELIEIISGASTLQEK
ncbi:ATP synthase subunit gamma, mitochondrial-like [Pectinophora gossypiella]|uniref:ATP synthase subunit gamma, mitochondrial-like n=1 Tax=Pectinophora gossypiella TaxID=13191 RepID=UPI00214ED315|nr:ATP synthase subunit gamma, mitochondrial-like [Pectinophora gossypiella]